MQYTKSVGRKPISSEFLTKHGDYAADRSHLDSTLIKTDGMSEDLDAAVVCSVRVMMLNNTANGTNSVPETHNMERGHVYISIHISGQARNRTIKTVYDQHTKHRQSQFEHPGKRYL